MSGLLTDITSRKISDTRQQLADSHDRLNRLTQSAPLQEKAIGNPKSKK